ncbi:MAG: YihY/virulence factor BrkB family protein [Spirochaetales bacterium]|nr:YihY/virulence factor BrkB family protein [Spirochaetales bacterium]
MNLNSIKKYMVIRANNAVSTARLFFYNSCPTMAAGLSYSSLLAIVPFLAFLFSLLNAFGTFSEELVSIQEFFLGLLMPTRQTELLDLFSSFLNNTRKLGVLGLALFAVTSVFLLDTVTGAFNSVWGTRSRRAVSFKFTAYLSLIVAGSLLLSVGLSLRSSILALFPGDSFAQLSALRRLPIRLIPFVFAFCFLSLLYKVLPAGHVRTSSAVLGAFWGTLFIELSRYWFLKIANTFIRMSVIYGSLAAVPIFLFWLYVLWLFTLLGLQIAYVHQYRIHFQKHKAAMDSPGEYIATGIEVFLAIAEGFVTSMPSDKELLRRFLIAPPQLKGYIDGFVHAGLIHEVRTKAGFSKTLWAPSKPLDSMTLSEVIMPLIGHFSRVSPSWKAVVHEVVDVSRKRTIKDVIAEGRQNAP